MLIGKWNLLALAATVSLLTACADTTQQDARSAPNAPSRIATIADARLQSDVMRMIAVHEAAGGATKMPTLQSAEVTRKEGMTIVERWVVKSGEKNVAYAVRLTPSPRGGVDYAVQLLSN